MANALTGVRLALVLPVALAFARPDLLAPGVLLLLLSVAIATDYLDGPVARRRGSTSARGQLFDHSTDCLFVTAGLTGAAAAGAVTPLLPILVPVAFGQYVLDSFLWHRQRHLRASRIGRWNGVLYFVPLALVAGSRVTPSGSATSGLVLAASTLGYVLVASTVVSVVDRATAPLRSS